MTQVTHLLAAVQPEALRLITGDPAGAAFPWLWLIAGVVVAIVVGVVAMRGWLGFVDRNAGALAFASVCRSSGISRRERTVLRNLAVASGCTPMAIWLSDHARAEAEKAKESPPMRANAPHGVNPRTKAAR